MPGQAAAALPSERWRPQGLANIIARMSSGPKTHPVRAPATGFALTDLRGKFEQAHALHKSGQLSEAQSVYETILKTLPGSFQALNSLGLIAGQRNNPRKALEFLGKAIDGDPENKLACVAHMNMGFAHTQLGNLEDALTSYERAIAIKPNYAEAYCNRGAAQESLRRASAALASYDRAIDINPAYADAYFNRGNVLRELREFEAAIESYDKAIALNPRTKFAHGVRLHTRMQICNWDRLAAEIDELRLSIERDQVVTSPFYVLALSDSAQLQLKSAEIRVRAKCPPNHELGNIRKRPSHGKLKIGYFSSDFHDHACMHLMAGVFERHDSSKFEVTMLSYGPDANDAMRKRVRSACTDFLDVRRLPDIEIARLARKRKIDIAVDLNGYSRDGRSGIFALRAASVQVSFLGYPGTLGASYIDYLIADRIVIPEQTQLHYKEKIIRLPNSYLPNDKSRRISDREGSREEYGLPPSAFVYCCFNNSYKITPDVFESWMRILQRVDTSVLWLLGDNPTAKSNLQREAIRRGVDGERLIFAPRTELSEHLARHRVADLFLDTLPCNAHTTASDALWAGLPVLTLAGEAFASRVGASLLHSAGLPELITSSRLEYETAAIELAIDSPRLQGFKQRLAHNRLTGPLFDAALFTRHLEDAYQRMYDRYQADLPPEHMCLES
jgi:predicted O-linked N-acetylglucosamine transferase (SPINDLY family)